MKPRSVGEDFSERGFCFELLLTKRNRSGYHLRTMLLPFPDPPKTLKPGLCALDHTGGGSGSKPRGGGGKRRPPESVGGWGVGLGECNSCQGEKGTINTWNNDRQFGFVSCDSGRPWAARHYKLFAEPLVTLFLTIDSGPL